MNSFYLNVLKGLDSISWKTIYWNDRKLYWTMYDNWAIWRKCNYLH